MNPLANLFSLKNHVAIVTGGAGYLGATIAEGLAEAGANVIITDQNENGCKSIVKEISVNNLSLTYELMDVSKRESIKLGFSDIFKKYGRIDILVNNAYYGASNKLEIMTDEEWQKGIDGSINSVFRCTQEVLHYMKDGSIINIASMYGVVSPDPSIYGDSGFDNPANYGAGKAAIVQFTRYCACHLSKNNIRVNSISPGPFPNPNVQMNTTFINNLEKKNPLGRIGRPEDLKGVVVFLASQASSYITGQNLMVDGGWTAW